VAVAQNRARNVGREIVERYGGLIISLCLNIVLFSFLLTTTLPEIRAEVVRRVNVILRPPAPTPIPPAPTLPLVVPPAAMATARKETPQQAEEPKQELQKPPSASAPTFSVQRISEEMLRSLAEEKKELATQEKQIERQKDDLRKRVEELAARDGGRQFMANTDGAAQGALRRLVLSDYPQNVVDRVLKRYDIKITTRYISAGKASAYLNMAETRQGTYYNQSGEGLYDVFELSRKAVAKMVSLEIAEMKRRGFDPNRTRTIEVHFGIVRNGDDYDLGIIKFKAEQIE
jgi:hypothetical protein